MDNPNGHTYQPGASVTTPHGQAVVIRYEYLPSGPAGFRVAIGQGAGTWVEQVYQGIYTISCGK
jgi:hypothetical protein